MRCATHAPLPSPNGACCRCTNGQRLDGNAVQENPAGSRKRFTGDRRMFEASMPGPAGAMTPSRGTMKVPARPAASVAGGGHEARVVRILVLVDLSLFARSWTRSRADAERHHKWLSGVPWNADALIERLGAGRRSRTRRPEPGADWPRARLGMGYPGHRVSRDRACLDLPAQAC